MQYWEYEVIELKGDKETEITPLLNEKGKKGYEVVSVLTHAGFTQETYIAFLKRPVE